MAQPTNPRGVGYETWEVLLLLPRTSEASPAFRLFYVDFLVQELLEMAQCGFGYKVQVGWPMVLVCLELRGLQGSRIFRLKTETVPGKLWHMIILSKGLLSIFLPQGRTVFHPNLRQRQISFYVMPLTRIISSSPPFQWSCHPWKLPALFQSVGSYSPLTCFKGPVSCPWTDTPAPLWHFRSISLCASKSCFSSLLFQVIGCSSSSSWAHCAFKHFSLLYFCSIFCLYRWRVVILSSSAISPRPELLPWQIFTSLPGPAQRSL